MEVNKDLVKIDYLQGMKYKDIADKFNVSIDTVKSWVKRYDWAKDKEQVNKKGAHNVKKGCTQNGKGAENKEENAHKSLKDEVIEKLGEGAEPIPYIENKDLNDKQKLFCIYYIKCFNATKAYQKAYQCGYSTAMTNGSALLRNTRIKDEIERLKADKLKGAFLSVNDLLQKYIDIALADISDYLDFGQKEIVKTNKKGGQTSFKINYVDLKNAKDLDCTLISEVKEGKDGISIKLIDKKFALEFLAKYSGLLDIETKQKLDIERRKMELAEKTADNLDDDIEYVVEGVEDEAQEG